MEIFKASTTIPFMKSAKLTIIGSIIVFVVALGLLFTKGLNLSIDFTGGTLIEVKYKQSAQVDSIRETLKTYGDVSVQHFGSTHDVLIRIPTKESMTNAKLSQAVLQDLQKQDQSVQLTRVEFVGPQVGKELFENGALALLLVSIGIVIYLAIRFEWRFAIGAIFATAHDIIAILGLFSLFQWEFSLTVLAAVLAILGYSVNDTVVIFDRIRENFKKSRESDVSIIIDEAVTQTLSRTIMTSSVTQLMVFSMLFFGGEVLHYFAVALTIGIVVGTYSSILVASPIVMWLGISRNDFIEKKKEVISGEVL